MKLVICKPQGYSTIDGLLREFWALRAYLNAKLKSEVGI